MSNTNKWNADKYNKHADFVSNLAFPVIELLDPQANERILDLGCGDGTLAVEIEKFKSKVIAVDLSESMVEKTKEKGIQASVMSATELIFENEFDAIFSNAVLHWVKDADKSIKKISNMMNVVYLIILGTFRKIPTISNFYKIINLLWNTLN